MNIGDYTSCERRTVFNTYENDGYASAEYLKIITYSYQMFERKKYYQEWYAFNPNTNNQNNLWTFPFNTGKYRDSKGYIEIKGTWLN